MKANLKKKPSPLIYVSATVFICLLGIFLPGAILQLKNIYHIGQSDAIPSEYYSNASLAISKNASSQLTTYEKMELISGTISSSFEEAESEESDMSAYDAVCLAQEALYHLYENNSYPYCPDSGFMNWYTWTATLYKSTDTNFHTYTAYCWKLIFTRYDASEVHTILMMENGTILYAATNNRSSHINPISEQSFSVYNYGIDYTYGTGFSYVNKSSVRSSQLPYYEIVSGELKQNDMTVMSCSILCIGADDIESESEVTAAYLSEEGKVEFYYVYQLVQEESYIYTLIPYD